LAYTRADKKKKGQRTTHNLAVNICKIKCTWEAGEAAQTQNKDGKEKITEDIITSNRDNKEGKKRYDSRDKERQRT
jgi:hypothetical protein